MEKVRIIFLDGTEIEADVNGDSYIVETKPTFPQDLSSITIVKGEDEQVLTNAKLVECASVDGAYWFAFVQMSAIEIKFAEIEDALCELSMLEEE